LSGLASPRRFSGRYGQGCRKSCESLRPFVQTHPWIGSHATSMSEHQDEGRISTIVMASINRAQSGVGGRPPGLDTTKTKDTGEGKLGAGKGSNSSDNPHSQGQS